MTKEQQEKIKELTGYSLVEIKNFTDGEFTRHIWKLYFKHVLTLQQYNWLDKYRKQPVDKNSKVQEVLDVFGGELL